MKTYKIYNSGIHVRNIEFKTESELQNWINEQMNYHGFKYDYKEI